MVQLHAARAGVPLNRPTVDVDIVRHIESGAAIFNEIKKQLEDLGYELVMPLTDDPIRRFTRGPEKSKQIVDVMVADPLSPRHARSTGRTYARSTGTCSRTSTSGRGEYRTVEMSKGPGRGFGEVRSGEVDRYL